MKTIKVPKIIFYSDIPRLFRSTLIGYLYEISQVWPVILLSEELDQETEKIINNKKLFPKLEKIIQVRQYGKEKNNLFFKNSFLFNLAKSIIKEYKPNIVIATGRQLFESYLRRFAKKEGTTVISGIGPLKRNIEQAKTLRLLTAVKLKMPKILPIWLRISLVKLRRHIGHFIYYWLLPLSVLQKPFKNELSLAFWDDFSRSQGPDFFLVFSKSDKDVLIKEGIPSGKLIQVAYPLEGKSRKFFKNSFYSMFLKIKKGKEKTLTIMWPNRQVGMRKSDYSLISEEEMEKTKKEIVNIICQNLKGWRILIKPHPLFKKDHARFESLKKLIDSVSANIEILDPLDIAEKYIALSNVVVGFSSVSGTFETTAMLYPKKAILAIDFNKELLGDYYRNNQVIEYISNKQKLVNVLKLIKAGKYKKNLKKIEKPEGFLGIVEALNWIWASKIKKY